MSYNIRNANSSDKGSRSWSIRLPIMASAIKTPSIVGFQEVKLGQLDDLKKTLEGYSYEGVGRDDGKKAGEFVPVFYKNEHWEKLAHGHFWLSDTPEKAGSRSWGNYNTRMCTWIRLKDKSGKAIYVYNIHLDHMSEKSRRLSASCLLEHINAREYKNEPVILMGDFNCKPDSEPLKILLADKKILIDSYTVIQRDPQKSSTFNSWKAGINGDKRIDYILTSPGLKVQSAKILNLHKDGVVASDHNAIEATLQWGE